MATRTVHFEKADSRNLPEVNNVMILEFMTNSSNHNIAEIRGAKALMSSRDSYLSSAVGYVEVQRSLGICTVKARVVPEHRTQKSYTVITKIKETDAEILDSNCSDCAASAGGGGAQLGEADNCDSNELKVCVELIPHTPVGLPKNKEELDAHCSAYITGMACMDAWIKKCLPTDGQKLVQQQIGGARALMRFLCTNETALRREFLKEPSCWARVSPEWSGCVNELQAAVHDITERSQLLTYFNRNAELCCARDAFLSCVVVAGRSCSAAASTLLRRMAWVLAQDVAACSQHPRAFCAAPAPPYAAPILTALSTIALYPPRL